MQRPYEKRANCRGEACFAQRSEDQSNQNAIPSLTLRLPYLLLLSSFLLTRQHLSGCSRFLSPLDHVTHRNLFGSSLEF
jgi:hypothetical protein